MGMSDPSKHSANRSHTEAAVSIFIIIFFLSKVSHYDVISKVSKRCKSQRIIAEWLFHRPFS